MSENNNNTNDAMDASDPAAATSWKLAIKTPKEKKDISIETSATVQQVCSIHRTRLVLQAALFFLVEAIGGQ